MRMRFSIGLVAVLCSGVAGCSSGSKPTYQSYLLRVGPSADIVRSPASPPPAQSFSANTEVKVREILLSTQQPIDPQSKIQLVSIDGDQKTTIRTQSGEIVSGRPGQFFSWPGVGPVELQLLSASPKDGEVLFEARGSLNH